MSKIFPSIFRSKNSLGRTNMDLISLAVLLGTVIVMGITFRSKIAVFLKYAFELIKKNKGTQESPTKKIHSPVEKSEPPIEKDKDTQKTTKQQPRIESPMPVVPYVLKDKRYDLWKLFGSVTSNKDKQNVWDQIGMLDKYK
ncbi:MAG: hypothetical protein KAH32_05300 [Chlamydiia bacterium]|nr:hypothetical protein [Chlamydiia bacterium]